MKKLSEQERRALETIVLLVRGVLRLLIGSLQRILLLAGVLVWITLLVDPETIVLLVKAFAGLEHRYMADLLGHLATFAVMLSFVIAGVELAIRGRLAAFDPAHGSSEHNPIKNEGDK